MKANIKQWLKAAGVRAVKTVAQTAVATIGTAALLGKYTGLPSARQPCSPGCSPCSPRLQGCQK